jgi:WD40 repeat protein
VADLTTPFIGPAPLGKGQQLFGRDTEVEELSWRTVADRIVVLYSPSGAGKTSLLTADNGLIADLSRRFFVPSILRLSGPPQQTLAQRLMSQLQGSGCGVMCEGDTLTDYVGRIELPSANPPLRLLLVIDQFEEVFTCGADEGAQHSFFRELGELLRRDGSSVWLIVSMREEYFSWLDPFRHHVPSRLANTYRLDLLSNLEAARAIRGPLLQHGVKLADAGSPEDVAPYIVGQLSKVRARGADGKLTLVDGKTVEPVHLQVACANLWQRLSALGPVQSLQTKDLAGFELEAALQDYCQVQLAKCTPDAKRARVVLDWIDRRLLTASGLRSPAIVDSLDQGMPTARELDLMQQAHLVRRQSRQDGEWYELSHDSLALPMRECIEAWRRKNLAVWQQLARSWQLEGEKDAYFKRLSPASSESIPEDESEACSEVETRFIDGFRTYRRAAQASRRMLLLFALLVAIAVPSVAWLSWNQLGLQAKLVWTREVTATQANLLALLGNKPPLELESLAVVAGTRLQRTEPALIALDFQSLLGDLLFRSRHVEAIEMIGNGKSIYLSSDGTFRAMAEAGKERYDVRVFQGSGAAAVLKDVGKLHPLGVRSILVLGDVLATGGQEGSIALWDARTLSLLKHAVPPAGDTGYLPLMRSAVRSIAWANGLLYAGTESGIVSAWKVEPRAAGEPVLSWTYRVQSRVPALAILESPSLPTRIVAADLSANEQVMLITPPTEVGGRPSAKPLPAVPRQDSAKGAFYSVVLSPDKKSILAGNRAGKIHVWDAATGTHLNSFNAHSGAVSQMRFLKDGRLLTAGWDGRLRAWNWRSGDLGAPTSMTMLEVPRQLLSFALSEEGVSAYVSTENGDVYRVALAQERHPLARVMLPDASIGSIDWPSKSFVASRGGEFLAGQLKEAQSTASSANQALGLVKAMARARDAGVVFAALKDAVYVSDGQRSKLTALEALDLGVGEILSIAVSDDASLLLALTQTTQPPIRYKFLIWSIDKSMRRAKLCTKDPFPVTFPKRTTRLATFRPGTRELVTVDADRLEFWRVNLKDECPVIEPLEGRVPAGTPSNEVRAVGFNPQGDTLWAANSSGGIFSFPSEGAERVTMWKVDAESVPTRIAVSRTGDIAFGDETGQLYVIRSGKRMPLQVVQELHNSSLNSLEISPDGEWLLSAGDGGLAVWNLRVDAWIEKACALTNRKDFSPEEAKTYFSNQATAPHSCGP